MPARKPTTTATVRKPKTASELTQAPARPASFRVSDDAKRGVSGKGKVARGVRPKRRDTDADVPMLVYIDGSNMQGFPLAHVGAAIQSGVITREEIEYLWSL